MRSIEFNRFGTLARLDAVEVIDNDTGRPVAVRGTLQSANGLAFRLNEAAAAGPRQLAERLIRVV